MGHRYAREQQQQQQLYDLVAAATTRVPLGETPHQSPRRGTNARLSPRVLHRRGITAFRRGSRFRRRGHGGGGGSSLLGRFRTSSSSPRSLLRLRLRLLGTGGRRIGDEVGREDIVKGDAAVMSFPPPLLLPVLLLLLPLPPLRVMTRPGLGPRPGALAGSKRRLVCFAIHFVNRSAARGAHFFGT